MTDRLHLPQRIRRTLEGLLREHVPEAEVWAYGSRITGESHEGSDLDLVVRGPDLKPLEDGFFELLEAIEQSNIPILVQVHDWARLPENFHADIERDYVALQVWTALRSEEQDGDQWIRMPLNELIDLRLSSVDKKSKSNERPIQLCNYMDVYNNTFIHGGMDFLPATATEREIERCSLVAGDVIITKDSEKHDDIGVPALVREEIPDLICGYHLAILRPLESKVDGSFLFYALSNVETQQQFHSFANGVTRFGLRKADIGLVEIPLPHLKDQRAIAHILATLDDKIELNRRMNDTLEQMARALFKSWFVDFDPVRAKGALTATPSDGSDWTAERARAYLESMDKTVVDLFPDRLVDSELGEIPEGWEVGTVSQLAERILNGGTPRRSEPRYWERQEIPWLTSGEVRQSFILGTENFISKEGLSESSAKMIPARSILVALYGATAGQVSLNLRPLSTNQAVSSIIPQKGNTYFCLMTLRTRVAELGNNAVGSAQQNISKKIVETTSAIIPSIELRSTYDVFVQGLLDKIANNLEKSQALIAQRDSLLPKLMSREVQAGDTLNHIGNAN